MRFCFQFAASLAAILEILDVAALAEGGKFEIAGGFQSEWRAHAWEGNYQISWSKFTETNCQLHGILCVKISSENQRFMCRVVPNHWKQPILKMFKMLFKNTFSVDGLLVSWKTVPSV